MGWFTDLIFAPDTKDDVMPDRRAIEKEFLDAVKYEDVDFFHLNGMQCLAKVVRVYDADTVHCIFFINGKAFKFKVRLARIDTAEKKSEDPAERAWAQKAIRRLEELIDGKLIWLKCHKWDKYGRLLGELYLSEESMIGGAVDDGQKSINQTLLDEGLAYEYHGGSREEFRDWAPWVAWLDFPEFRPTWKSKPVDNIGDQAVLDDKPVEGVDFKKSDNLENRG